jgi:hypothetical protein
MVLVADVLLLLEYTVLRVPSRKECLVVLITVVPRVEKVAEIFFVASEKDEIERVFSRVQNVECGKEMNGGSEFVVVAAAEVVEVFSCVKSEQKKMMQPDEFLKKDAIDAMVLKEGGVILK